jgi:S-ribosylhomocysteine lyase
MLNLEQLGWDPQTVGELDHRLLQAPHIKLRSATRGACGDVVYAVDLRITRPNANYMSIVEMHSLEHFLLRGFQKYLPNHFISIGLMGCRTGFYLVFLNEGRTDIILETFGKILRDILNATEVPFATIAQCGNYTNHDLATVQKLAEYLLKNKSNWRQVIQQNP